MSRFVALHATEETNELLKRHPNAFLLLTQIALRAKWKDCPITKLKAGQAFIGDWRNAGLDSEKSYRCAKKTLTDCQIAAFTGASKGTVATILDSTIYSNFHDPKGGQTDDLGASQGRTKGEPRATNNTDTQIQGHTDTLLGDQLPGKQPSKKSNPKSSPVQSNSPVMSLIGSWFGRDSTDLWGIKEANVLKAIHLKEKDLQVLDAYYRLTRERMVELNGGDYRRKKLPTLLNNWKGDCDEARGFVVDHGLEVRDLSAVLNPQPDLLLP